MWLVVTLEVIDSNTLNKLQKKLQLRKQGGIAYVMGREVCRVCGFGELELPSPLDLTCTSSE